tara:strand:+ start:963 stop:1505 length:543 start_codon:yes stop_codon:yes gene_type:complete
MEDLNAFDRSTKFWVFTGKVKQQIDPISKEPVPLRYATNKELLPEKEGFVQGFVTGEWKYYADNRGKEYYDEDGTKHTITELGEEVPEDALLEAPVIPLTVSEQKALASAECTTRINQHWNQIGQINASLGVYGELDTANCAAWISSNRSALIALLSREDLLEIDVADDQHWPVFEDSSE